MDIISKDDSLIKQTLATYVRKFQHMYQRKSTISLEKELADTLKESCQYHLGNMDDCQEKEIQIGVDKSIVT